MSSRSRRPQVDLESLKAELSESLTAELLATMREEWTQEQAIIQQTLRDEFQVLSNTLGNREQGDQAGAASVQQDINDKFDTPQEQLQQERIDHQRRMEVLQANQRQQAATLVVPHHNGMRRKAQIGMMAFQHAIEDIDSAITLLNTGDIPPHVLKAISKLSSVKSSSLKHRFHHEAMVFFIEETDAINDPRELAISLRGRGTTECRLRLNELTSHSEEDMKAFKAWVRDFVKSSLKSCDSAKLLQAQNAKLRQPLKRFEAQQGANKKHKGNNNKSQQASASASAGPEILDDQE